MPRQLSALRCPAGAPAPRVQGWRWLAAADTIAAGSARALRCPAGVLARVGGGPSPVEVAALAPSVPADLTQARARVCGRLCVHLPKSAGGRAPRVEVSSWARPASTAADPAQGGRVSRSRCLRTGGGVSASHIPPPAFCAHGPNLWPFRGCGCARCGRF